MPPPNEAKARREGAVKCGARYQGLDRRYSQQRCRDEQCCQDHRGCLRLCAIRSLRVRALSPQPPDKAGRSGNVGNYTEPKAEDAEAPCQ